MTNGVTGIGLEIFCPTIDSSTLKCFSVQQHQQEGLLLIYFPLLITTPKREDKMATATMTQTVSGPRKVKQADLAPESERFLRCCADVANALIEDHEAQKDGKASKDINLNALRGKMSKKHKLAVIPPLTAIIAAIPEHYKKYILPKLIAKPIRTLCPKEN